MGLRGNELMGFLCEESDLIFVQGPTSRSIKFSASLVGQASRLLSWDRQDAYPTRFRTLPCEGLHQFVIGVGKFLDAWIVLESTNSPFAARSSSPSMFCRAGILSALGHPRRLSHVIESPFL